MESYLTMNISYFMKDGSFKITGNVKKEAQSELILEILRNEFGKSEDNRKAEVRDEYNLQIKWHPPIDKIEISDNTENYGLRDGILIDILSKL